MRVAPPWRRKRGQLSPGGGAPRPAWTVPGSLRCSFLELSHSQGGAAGQAPGVSNRKQVVLEFVPGTGAAGLCGVPTFPPSEWAPGTHFPCLPTLARGQPSAIPGDPGPQPSTCPCGPRPPGSPARTGASPPSGHPFLPVASPPERAGHLSTPPSLPSAAHGPGGLAPGSVRAACVWFFFPPFKFFLFMNETGLWRLLSHPHTQP